MPLIKITDQTFGQEVLQSDKSVLVDFWAVWCGPCRLAEPVLEELSDTYKDKIVVAKLDVDQNKTTPEKYDVMSIPTTILFKDGKEIDRQIGFSGKDSYEELIKKAL